MRANHRTRARAPIEIGNGQFGLLFRDTRCRVDDLPALEARAQLRLQARTIAGATADLGAADRAASKEADIRLFLPGVYQDADLLPARSRNTVYG